MKPKILKISGLNSFSQTEKIDFEKLTSRGLFGIFGPTGSGKSTVLDAITLALYGKVARETKSYINSDSEVANIYFEFTSGNGHKEKKYIVERTIKRTKAGTQNAKVKLEIYDLKDNLEKLIENVTPVQNELCENIIKLNFDDFIKTVVLPQGKFSEFLTLTGGERNNMLERILGLEEYGRTLTAKIKSKQETSNMELRQLQGELDRYSDSSPKILEDLLEKQKELSEEEEILKEQIVTLEEEYKKYAQIYLLQEELKGYLKKQEEIETIKDEMDEKRKKLQRGKDALNMGPYIAILDESIKERKENILKLEKLIVGLEKSDSEIEITSKEYKEAFDLKEKEHAKLIEKKLKLDAAIVLEKENIENAKQLLEQKSQSDILTKNIVTLELKRNTERLKQEELNKKIENAEKLVKINHISSEYKNRLIEGVNFEKKHNEKHKELAELKTKSKEFKASIDKGKLEIAKLDSELKDLEKRKDLSSIDYVKLKDLLLLKEVSLKEILNRIEEIKAISIASTVAKTLEEDSPCPVCGSTDHPNIVENVNDDELEIELKKQEVLVEHVEKLKSQLNLIYSISSSNSVNLKEAVLQSRLTDEYIASWSDTAEKLKSEIENIIKTKLDLDKKQIKYAERLNNLEENFKNTEKEVDAKEKEQLEISKNYEDLKRKLEVEDIAKRYEELMKIEKELEKLNKELLSYREELKEILESSEVLHAEISKSKETLGVLNESIKNKKNLIEKNESEISQIAESESPTILKANVEKRIAELLENEKLLKEKLEKLKEKNLELKEQKQKIENSNEKLSNTINNTEKKLNSLLSEYKFESIDSVRTASICKEDIEELEQEIDKYSKEKENIASNIRRVKELLNGESISIEELENLKIKKSQAITRQKDLLEEKGKLMEQITEMRKNLERVKAIKKQVKILEIRKDSLDEIFKLTSGKKFVEFVSRNHLKYIVRVATEKLKSITRDRYALRLSEDNTFEVIDNYNGGVVRDASSLSGGETFLASLALALALSTRIQLKGDTSMEFFFLDEGFGTLDVETLDTAMTALENLHADNLSVGIISHVEEIKNRVPIKLMISAPIPGGKGSKVEIVMT